MHFCLVAANLEAPGFAAFRASHRAIRAGVPWFWQNQIGFMNENNSAGNHSVEELRGLLDRLDFTTAIADENEQLRKPAELGDGAHQPHRLPAARAERCGGSGQGRGMNDGHVGKVGRSILPTIQGLPLRPAPRCPASLAGLSGQILRRMVLDRLDMVAAGAPERHQFRMRAHRGNAANAPHRSPAARARQFGLARALHKSLISAGRQDGT
jgi:hypothetical protein